MIFDYFKNVKKEINDITSMLNNTSVFNKNVATSNIDADTLSQLNMGYSDGQMTSGYSSAIEKLASSYNEATAEANALKMAQDGLSKSTVEDILAKQNWSKVDRDAALSSQAFKDVQTASTASMNVDTGATWANVAATKALSAAKKGLSIIGGIALSAAISIGISALTKLADSIITTKKELKEAAETARQTIDDIKESFETLRDSTNNIKDRYAELSQEIDQISGKNLTLSDDEYKEFLNLSNQLSELFPSLTKNYDENGNAILDLTGNVNSIVSSLDALVKKEQELANQKILDEMPDVYAELVDNISKHNKQLDVYKSFKDSMPGKVEVDYMGKTSFNVSDARYFSKDITKDIRNKFAEKFKEYELDGAIANTTYNHDGTLQFNITGLKNTQEYRDKLNQIYDEIKADIIKKIQEMNSSVKSEMDNFNEYIYTWLSFDGDYANIDNEGLKTAIQELLFNSNWINDLPDNIDSTKWNDKLEEWLKTNYLDAINNIKDEEYKQKLADLFTLDLKPQDKVNLAQELQDYFDANNIKISLDFILDENDPNSEQNLINRVTERNEQIAGSVDVLKGKYEELKEAREKAYTGSDYVGNVDVNNRPIVTDSNLGGDYQTSYTGFQEYKNSDGTYEIIHFTPILPDGTVLDDNTLYEYLDNVIAKSQNKLDADKVENGGKGILYKVDTTVNGEKITDNNLDNAFKQAEQWDIQMHEQQALIYDKEASALIAYNEALDEHNKLNQYFKDNSIDTTEEYNKWLEVTDGAENATQAIYLYDQYLKSVNNQEFDFFTDDNLNAIDNYKSKISDLSSYLDKINSNGKLSADDLSKLNIEYGIIASSVDGYKEAIIAEMNEAANNSDIMKILAEAIEYCNDAILRNQLESLYESLQNVNVEAQKAATSFEDLGDAISTLDSSSSLLRDLNEEIKETGRIDFSNIDDILSTFPQLTEEVAMFNAGLIDSEELFDILEQAYQDSADEYANTIESELQYNEEFYDHITDNLEDWVLNMAEAYDINLKDYKTLNEEKLALDKEYARRKAILDEALLKNEAMNDVLQSPESKDFTGDDFRKALDTHEAYLVAQSDVDNIQAIIEAVDTAFTTDVSWETFGKKDNDSGNSKEDDVEIDWADQSLKVLQDDVDKFQKAFDNTKGLENQIDAIDDLNGALTRLKGGYETAYEKYKTRYDNAVKNLGEDIRKKIESGEEFDLSIYDSETAKDIQTATDNFNKMSEAEAKVVELSNQIDFNDNIEKSKLLQQSYELQLETINTKLEDQTLSVDEKNALLDEQLRLQIAINDRLREQAKYEGDYETISKLDAEDKNRKLQKRLNKLQNKKDENQVYIDTYEEKLKDATLTSDDINSLNNGLQSVTNRDFKLRFKEMIATAGTDWDDYIASLKEKYSEQNMTDKKFIKKHLGEISQYFSYLGMEELYYEYLNSERGFEETDYETKKNERSYYLNDTNNNIQDIQNAIELQGGQGTKEQYKELESLYNTSKDYWTQQKADAEAMRDSFTPFTAEWDKWNNEAQECDNNIQNCDSGIKDCQISILKLPLKEVEKKLKDIEDKLDNINESLEYQTDLISAATAIIDNEIENQETLKEAIQDKIDALEKENSLRQSNLNVQKAEYELQKLKNQKTSKIFREGQGWVYESDADSINDAQANYDNAVYEHKIALLQDQINVYDEEIERLNDIKDKWSSITTDAENIVLINKAIASDSSYIRKVLGEDSYLMNSISSSYSSLLQQKNLYEQQQKDYTSLQDIIDDTVEMYELEGISYEEAKQRIKDAIVQYYPEIVANYEDEEEALERVATKKLEDAGVTEETSEDILETVKKSNKKILKSYNKLAEGLDEVFVHLNEMLGTYSANTQAMVDSISASIQSLRNQLAAVQSEVANTTVTTEATISVESSGSKNTSKDTSKNTSKNTSTKKKKEEKAGKSHSGLELGYIGEGNLSQDKKDFKYIALTKLKDDEIVRVLQRGEAVMDSNQIMNTMSNFRKLAQFKTPTIPIANTQSNRSVNFNGDIIIQNTQNANNLAKAIKTQLPQQMLQELYK